jgi:dephospho-CoA kinase
MIKIGLVGTAGSGKDTAAGYLVENFGFMRFAFADRLNGSSSTMNKNTVGNYNKESAKRLFSISWTDVGKIALCSLIVS